MSEISETMEVHGVTALPKEVFIWVKQVVILAKNLTPPATAKKTTWSWWESDSEPIVAFPQMPPFSPWDKKDAHVYGPDKLIYVCLVWGTPQVIKIKTRFFSIQVGKEEGIRGVAGLRGVYTQKTLRSAGVDWEEGRIEILPDLQDFVGGKIIPQRVRVYFPRVGTRGIFKLDPKSPFRGDWIYYPPEEILKPGIFGIAKQLAVAGGWYPEPYMP